jgi:hypothetical protein
VLVREETKTGYSACLFIFRGSKNKSGRAAAFVVAAGLHVPEAHLMPNSG